MKLKGISDKGVKRLASTLQPTRASKDQFIHDMESDITKLLDAWRERLDKETSEGYPVDMYDSNDIVSGTLEMIENQLGLGLDLSDSVEPRALAEAVEEELSADLM